MCGIVGKINFGGSVDPELLRTMCACIHHRGPDSQGVHASGEAGLAMQRLAIIDVAGGDQPIFNEDGTVAVVMNGEIYNHVELREDLQRRGHRFTTHVDTEVLVHLYEEHGERLAEHLRGMFAFAIWDARRRRLVLGRDRVGKKPLFYARIGERFWFGSELRALLQDPAIPRDIDLQAIDAFLTLQYIPHPLSAFKAIRKLPPASTMVVTADGEEIRRYWRLSYGPKHTASPDELKEQLRELLDEATRIRLMSEVPLGAFLSGGVDSSAIVASMASQGSGTVRTFSIAFSERDFDEAEYARMVAQRFSTHHEEFRVEPEALEILPQLARHYGEPFGDPSAIPSFYLAQMTSRHVTVALNGDGGDESFGGYGRYVRGQRVGRLDWLPGPVKQHLPALTGLLPSRANERAFGNRVRRLADALAASTWESYTMSLTSFDRIRREALTTPAFRAALDGTRGEDFIERAWNASPGTDDVERFQDVDIETYLPGDLLPKVDIATMAYSLEGRSPLLDHVLMEWAARVPSEFKLRRGEGKWILKEAMRGVLPDVILDRPKMGFGVPLAAWFRGPLRDLPGERLLDPAFLARGWFSGSTIEHLIAEHQSGDADHALRLWSLVQLDEWLREVVDRPPDTAPVEATPVGE